MFLAMLVLFSLPSARAHFSTPTDEALLIRLEGALSVIDLPARDYLREAIRRAESLGAPLLIVMDSYGGYLDSMVDMGDLILNARVPVVCFVESKALSAASIVVQAAHVVAVSPYGVMGAAQPMSINPLTGEYVFVNESKIINTVIALAKRYAEARGRNATAVEHFITKNLVVRGVEAVKLRVADIVANSIDELVGMLNGSSVTLTVRGERLNVTLRLRSYEELQPPLHLVAYSYLRDPTINAVFWLIGFLGTAAAVMSGRFDFLPFTTIFIILALLGGGFSLNLIAVLLMALGAVFVALEIATPGFGIFGISGIIALFFGLLLMPLQPSPYTAPQFYEGLRNFALIVGGGVGALIAFVVYKAVESRRKREAEVRRLIKFEAAGKVVERIEPERIGVVAVGGEYWYAKSDEFLEPGDEVIVVGRDGFVLKVKKRAS